MSRNIEVFQIRRNDAGEYLLVIPAGLRVPAIQQFMVDGEDLLLKQSDGGTIRLLEVPDPLIVPLRQVDTLRVVEVRDQQPVAEHQPHNMSARSGGGAQTAPLQRRRR